MKSVRVDYLSYGGVYMNIFEFADICDLQVEVKRYPNQNNRWTAKFNLVSVREAGGLVSVYGDGKSADAAIREYWDTISGKKLYIGRATKNIAANIPFQTLKGAK